MTEGIATPGAGWRRADGWVGKKGGKRRRSGRRAVGEVAMVDEAEFTSYYDRPIIKAPVWKSPDVPLYLFLGGAAGTSSILGAMADLSGRPTLTRVSRLVAGGGSIASVAFLVHDLGRPERFLHMLRVIKPTSALSVGTYILSPFSAAAGATAAVELLGWFPRLKRFGGIVSALFGGPMATYTAVLLANTAVPSWRAPHKQLPFVFAGSAMAAGGGITMVFTPVAEAGRPRTMLRAAKACTAAGAGLTVLAGRTRLGAVASGTLLAAGSLLTRFGVFDAGMASARDPKYTVVPQQERKAARAQAPAPSPDGHAPTVTP